jgi:cytochrome c556
MLTRVCGVLIGGALTLAVLCLPSSGAPGGGKETVWKEFLSDKDAQELTKRSLEEIKEALSGKPDEDAIKKARFHLLSVAAYARSTKGGDAAKRGATYQHALQVATLLGQKGKLKEAMMLLGKGAGGKGGFDGDLKTGGDAPIIMEHYKTKGKGGEGIHPALQSNIKLKGTQNGIEEKIRTLILKRMQQPVLDKEAEELALMAYRIAAVAELAHEYAPAKKTAKKDPDEWRVYSVTMRDAAIELGEAAHKKDVEAVFKASNRLNSSCSQCHGVFRLGI